jgi:galactose-1-phosphate uridylyltransferase
MAAHLSSPDGLDRVERHLEVRFDPLLGSSSRIVEGVQLQQAEPTAVDEVLKPDEGCPFCPARIEQVTPRIRREIVPEGRIQLGETVLFPNLAPYSRYAAVAIFSPRHRLFLPDFQPALLRDNLRAAIRYIREVHRFDCQAQYCAYNINYLYPSGGSLPHPHAQLYVDPLPTTMMRLQLDAGKKYLSEHGRSFWEDFAAEEEQQRDRFVGRLGATTWMTAFAPLGFNEVRAVVSGRETLLDLSEEDADALAQGTSRVLSWYDQIGYNSFNLALYSGPLRGQADFRVNLSMVTRASLLPFYRSDAMYLERLHWEAAVDRAPEAIAGELRTCFPV